MQWENLLVICTNSQTLINILSVSCGGWCWLVTLSSLTLLVTPFSPPPHLPPSCSSRPFSVSSEWAGSSGGFSSLTTAVAETQAYREDMQRLCHVPCVLQLVPYTPGLRDSTKLVLNLPPIVRGSSLGDVCLTTCTAGSSLDHTSCTVNREERGTWIM